MHKTSLIILLLIASISSWAQIPKNTWREHLPYNEVHTVALAGNRVYAATPQALFYYNKEDQSVNKLSKINKLSDLGVGYIAYHEGSKSLLVGYHTGNIDLLNEDQKFNYPDIKNKNLTTEKGINHILVHQDKAYFSTGFGIVVFDLNTRHFDDTYIIGNSGAFKNINACVVHQDTLFALCHDGIYKGAMDNPFLGNYQEWTKEENLDYPSANYISGVSFNNKLYVLNNFPSSDSCLISVKNTKWEKYSSNYSNTRSISKGNNYLIITQMNKVTALNTSNNIELDLSLTDCQHCLIDTDNTLWGAEKYEGLIRFKDSKSTIYPSGPVSSNVFALDYAAGSILAAPGGYQSTGSTVYNDADTYQLKDEQWSNIRYSNAELNELRAAVCFAPTSKSDHYFVGTWGYGLFEIMGQDFVKLYNAENTDQGVQDFVSDMHFDAAGNLWVMNRNVQNPIAVKTPDNQWYNYAYNQAMSYQLTGKLIQTANGDFWTASSRGNAGLLVWNANNTPETDADDIYQSFKLLDEEGKLINGEIHDLAEDKNELVWVACSDGVVVYDYPWTILQGESFYARRPQITVDGFYKALLEGEKVTSIAIDGANRKWFGTEGGGLFLVSADGTQQLLNFNTENSPLFSNNILSLAFLEETGELFVATYDGIVSYMTSSSGTREEFTDIYAFPNPVKPGYNGYITIRGLVYNTDVRITDTSGKLVFSTISNGGDALWNGKNMEGKDVSSGIYLVLLSNADGTNREVTKILIVR